MQKNALCRPKRSAQRPGPKPGHAPLVYRLRGYLLSRCRRSDSALVCGVVENLQSLGWGGRRAVLRALAQLRAWDECGLRFLVHWDYDAGGWSVACCTTEELRTGKVYLSHRDSRGRPKRWRPTCRAAEWTEEELLLWCGRATPLSSTEIESRRRAIQAETNTRNEGQSEEQDSDNAYIGTGSLREPTQNRAAPRSEKWASVSPKGQRWGSRRRAAHRRVVGRLVRGFVRASRADEAWLATQAGLSELGVEGVANQVALSAAMGGWSWVQLRQSLGGAADDLRRALVSPAPPLDRTKFYAAAAWRRLRSGRNGGLTRADRVMGRRLEACAHATPQWRREARALNAAAGGLSVGEFRARLSQVAEGGADAVQFLRATASPELWGRLSAWTPLPVPQNRLVQRLLALSGGAELFAKREADLALFCLRVTSSASQPRS
jgi:hypothetical protein